MSLESANAFWKRVQTDGQFRDRLKAAKTEHEMGSFMISSGYTVTAEELESSVAEWNASSGVRELSDDELETVAGGAFGLSTSSSLGIADMQRNINIVGRGKGG